MKLFIIQYVDQLTSNYHSGGGIVIIAPTLELAKSIASSHESCSVTDEEWESADVYEVTDPVEPKVYLFPDAGCC